MPGALGLVGEARRLLGRLGRSALERLEPRLVEVAMLLVDVAGDLTATSTRWTPTPSGCRRCSPGRPSCAR